MIELINVNKIYTHKKSGRVTTALANIHLSVARGEIYGVIGKSGAGKSTLIRCVNLLERPTSGIVKIDGENIVSLSEKALRTVRHSMGMIFQHFNLLSTRTVFQNVAFPLELLKKNKKEIRVRVNDLLELVGLKDHCQAYPNQLSGGQNQRVAIARALATAPKVLLCDEMTSALDPQTTLSILNLVKDINKKMNVSILLITHEMEVIKNMADRVAVIEAGHIIEEADVVSLFKNPKTDIAKSLTQSVMQRHLPESLQNQLSSTPLDNGQILLRIIFSGETTSKPIMETLIRHSKISVNILQANVECLRHDVIGMMVITAKGKADDIEKAIAFLMQHNLSVEVLGYVRADYWINS